MFLIPAQDLTCPDTVIAVLTSNTCDLAHTCDLTSTHDLTNTCVQVVTGGNFDVDVHVVAPNGQVLYKDVKQQYDTFTWTAEVPGVYTVCFSNEFSSFTHKVVYFAMDVGEEKPIVEQQEGQATAMTLVSGRRVGGRGGGGAGGGRGDGGRGQITAMTLVSGRGGRGGQVEVGDRSQP